MTKRLHKGQKIAFWWSASYVHEVKFVRWCRMRMHTGSKDTNKIGVGAIVESDWMFSKAVIGKVPRGLRRGQYRLRPYTELYRTYNEARCHINEIQRPAVNRVRKESR